MTDVIDPNIWLEISAENAAQGTVVRRVVPHLQHDVFIGEHRPSRQRVLLLDIKDHSTGLAPGRPSSRGLEVLIDSSDSEITRLRLTSTATQGNPIFEELADDVIGVLIKHPDEGAAVRVLERVKAWQSFFARRPVEFSVEKAAGLFAELTVLHEAWIPALGPSSAVATWSGPDPAVQDFQWADLAVEVKSFRGTGPGHLTISSERQLETTGIDSLYVAYIRLDQRTEGSGATLAETIESVRSELRESAFAQDQFDEKLLSYGWHRSFAEFRNEKYEVRSNELFAVVEGFPRIVSAELGTGVGGVSYLIDRSALEAFLVPWDELGERLKEGA
jgi:hypothetical protein